jgi:UDP-N-acetylmuramoyl-tripeptide--D-alanyl-D-alanine ligase
MSMAARTNERIVTFGRAGDADYKVRDISSGLPDRLSLTMETPQGVLKLQTRFAADHHHVAVAAATACALELGIEPGLVQQQVNTFEPWWDRCQPLEIPGGPTFLIDSLKAPLYSLDLAISTVEKARYGKKRIVIGHLADHPGNSRQAVRKAKRLAADVADELIFVGHSAERLGLSDEDVASGKYTVLTDTRELSDYLHRTGTPGELILLKSSGILHVERAVLSWLTEVNCWVARCSKKSSCLKCGRQGVNYSLHKGVLPSGWARPFRPSSGKHFLHLRQSLVRHFIP